MLFFFQNVVDFICLLFVDDPTALSNIYQRGVLAVVCRGVYYLCYRKEYRYAVSDN
jgi:hypothetical protein